MVKYITFGDFNPKYKYIFFYIITRLLFEYFFGDAFPEEMKLYFLRNENLPNSIFVFDIFKYLGILIFGLIANKLEFKTSQFESKSPTIKNNEKMHEIKLIYNKAHPKFSFTVVIKFMPFKIQFSAELFLLLIINIW